jgi:hypothetical protein
VRFLGASKHVAANKHFVQNMVGAHRAPSKVPMGSQ